MTATLVLSVAFTAYNLLYHIPIYLLISMQSFSTDFADILYQWSAVEVTDVWRQYTVFCHSCYCGELTCLFVLTTL